MTEHKSIEEKKIEEIKEEVAVENGFILEMPTKWGYAMLVTSRTKRQLDLYEQVIWKLTKTTPHLNSRNLLERFRKWFREWKPLFPESEPESVIMAKGYNLCLHEMDWKLDEFIESELGKC